MRAVAGPVRIVDLAGRPVGRALCQAVFPPSGPAAGPPTVLVWALHLTGAARTPRQRCAAYRLDFGGDRQILGLFLGGLRRQSGRHRFAALAARGLGP